MAAGPAPGVNVNVVNSPTNPVPVTGSIGLSGTASVNVVNTPNVKVVNTVPTVNAANPAFQPFQDEEVIGWNAGSGLIGNDGTFLVPSGKRLVIEFVSFELTIPTGTRPTFNSVKIVNANSNTIPISFLIPLSFQGSAFLGGQNSDVFIGSSPTRLYADPGSTVTLSVRTNNADNGLAEVSVSGYLVDVQ